MRCERNHGSESGDWCIEHQELIWECRCDQPELMVIPGVDEYARALQRAADDA